MSANWSPLIPASSFASMRRSAEAHGRSGWEALGVAREFGQRRVGVLLARTSCAMAVGRTLV